MLSLKMFERLAIVAIIIAFLLVGMTVSGMFRSAKGSEIALSETTPPYTPSYPIRIVQDQIEYKPHSLIITFSISYGGHSVVINGFKSKKSCDIAGITFKAERKKDGWESYYYCVAKDD